MGHELLLSDWRSIRSISRSSAAIRGDTAVTERNHGPTATEIHAQRRVIGDYGVRHSGSSAARTGDPDCIMRRHAVVQVQFRRSSALCDKPSRAVVDGHTVVRTDLGIWLCAEATAAAILK